LRKVPKEYEGGDVRLVFQQPISVGGFFLLDCSVSRQAPTLSGVIGVIMVAGLCENRIE
jgi:hypothetical protein